jgi:isoleucyl-tRNA synthetase
VPFIEDVDLAELAITSSAEVIETYILPENGFTLEDVPGISVLVTLATGEKCHRCWKVLPEVGKIKTSLDLCHRCAKVVEKIS